MIVLFTGNCFVSVSLGYNKDIENIKDVFFKKLKYKFYHYKNLTYNKTLEKLSGVKQILEELDEDDVPVYDRLAVFFLSHGDQVSYVQVYLCHKLSII